jgi:anti-anti-sigma regulatory factor
LDGNLDIGRYPEFRSAFERVPAELPVLVDISEVG